ncbi:MAG: SulP family inorganic anion transporter [Gammaproteobacteria bacterium]|nr:SulP family inorganic anion transporter [Gammaproteobacteria bacterium]
MKIRRYFSLFSQFVPFLSWIGELRDKAVLRADIIAGITVALVLIPQSMAYAQLAGLPPYFGLYAAFLPPMIAAIFGSSRQLATGPVAVVSLLSAAALEPLATAGSSGFVAYAIMLALLVGLFQLALGLLRLGVLVNFLSHSVVLGFTNAAAIIIATSQLGKIFGVTVEKAPHHYETVWNTLAAASENTHWPTLIMAVLAFAMIIGLRRINPRIPGVLLAVAVTTLLSFAMSFEKAREIELKQLDDRSVRQLITAHLDLQKEIAGFDERIKAATAKHKAAAEKHGEASFTALSAVHELNKERLRLERRQKAAKDSLNKIKAVRLQHVEAAENVDINEDSVRYFPEGEAPKGRKADKLVWRITRLNKDGSLVAHAGGQVVGSIPEGLPSFKLPDWNWGAVSQIFVSAIAIALIGFMEAISIAKAMAARTRQRLDANQELVGQGIGNIVGSFFQSYATSGSFSRSAVNIGAGAKTGLSSVITSLVVVITLLWLTPLLYHLPQATLAAVIMMAVIGLVNFKAIHHTWKVKRTDGAISMTTFVLTLAFAPHLENAIVIGLVLSLGLFLYQTMKPRVVTLSRHPDGSLRDAELFNLDTCKEILMIRFDGSLYFANTSYFEDMVLHKSANAPELKYVIVDGQGINEIDATGEEMLRELAERLEKAGVKMMFTQFKKQVMDVLWHSGFLERMGENRFFRRADKALDFVWKELGDDHELHCPLNTVCLLDSAKAGGQQRGSKGFMGLFKPRTSPAR